MLQRLETEPDFLNPGTIGVETIFLAAPTIATVFLECFYYYYMSTTCFGPYGPSSSGIYTYILVNS
jgi:hypothetical protein